MTCFLCGKGGHKVEECYKNPRLNQRKTESIGEIPSRKNQLWRDGETAKEKDLNKIKCFKCKKYGHYVTECPEKKTQYSVTMRKVETSNTFMESNNEDVEDVSVKKLELEMPFNSTSKKRGTQRWIEVQRRKEEIPINNTVQNACLHTPCYLEGEKIIGFVDAGATTSFISKKWVEIRGFKIVPRVGKILQFIDGSEHPRIGAVENLLLENGIKKIKVNLEVAALSGDEELIIGMDLFKPLGYELLNVPFTWPEKKPIENTHKKEVGRILERPIGVGEDGIAEEWRKVLEDNQNLPVDSRCRIEDSELSIETGDAEPIWIRQYPIAEGYRYAVDAQVQTWSKVGTIVPAPLNCKWNLPLLAVRKPSKDGSPDGVRVVLDARSLNEEISKVPDSHLPGLRELVDRLGSFEWITVLDLTDSYNQFPLRKEDQCKTAFTWGGKQWMFTGVPFGLKIMIGHMQRIMERLLMRFGRFPFQDDVAIPTKKGGDHIEDVLEVLKCLTYEAGLRLRLKKCKFFQVEARVLGSLLTREGIRMDPLKVKAIMDWPKPVDSKAMQRFLGAANFHREFSDQFAKISAPLEECRNINGLIEWTEVRTHAFEELKKLFAANILLKHIDWKKIIYLTTDASLVGVGAWIGQKDDLGEVQPVVCISKKLTSTQQRWSPTKRELWGLMWAMQKLRYYLLGRWFIARVDHRPLVTMVQNKLNIMMEGWVDTILQFRFSAEYIPGKDNWFADALSRCHDEVGGTLKVRTVEVVTLTSDQIEKTLMLEAEKRGKKIPTKEIRAELVEKAHQLGHFSTEGMFRKLWNDGYWWPSMRKDLIVAVQSCIDCLRFNIVQEGFHPLQSIEANKPWDHIQIDLIGPLPISTEGYEYILTVVDILTSYTVLRPLKNRDMESIARAMWIIFCEYGTVKILQSDNGPEFVNSVMEQLTQLYGIDHRLITAYHPRANGKVERRNKEVSRGLKKYMVGATGRWEDWLPLLQIGLNQKYLQRVGTTPFTIMYGRSFNDFMDFGDVSDMENSIQAIRERLHQLEELQEVVIPATVERSKLFQKKTRENFDQTHKQFDSLLSGTRVMAVDQTRSTKWDPVYEGPYTVVKQNRGGAYQLKDATGELLKRKMTMEMLKVIPSTVSNAISMDMPSGGEKGSKFIGDATKNSRNSKETISDKGKVLRNSEKEEEELHFRVENILDHQLQENGESYSYLVQWKGYDEEENSWVDEKDFDDLAIIKNYWRKANKDVMVKKKASKKKTFKSKTRRA